MYRDSGASALDVMWGDPALITNLDKLSLRARAESSTQRSFFEMVDRQPFAAVFASASSTPEAQVLAKL
jgi:hypothetical protein